MGMTKEQEALQAAALTLEETRDFLKSLGDVEYVMGITECLDDFVYPAMEGTG